MTQNPDFLNFKVFTERKQNQTWYGLRTHKTFWYCWIWSLVSDMGASRKPEEGHPVHLRVVGSWMICRQLFHSMQVFVNRHGQVCFASSVVTDCSLHSVSVCTRRASWLVFLSSCYCLRQAVWGEFSTDEHTQLNNSWSHCTLRASRAKKEDVGAILITFQASYGRLFHPWYTDTQPLGECLFLF